MDTFETALAVVAILAGFGVGFAFRGWYARKVERKDASLLLKQKGK